MKYQKVSKEETVKCGKCSKVIGLRDTYGTTGLAWFDPYIKGVQAVKGYKGAYVHKSCLSKKRKMEVEEQGINCKLSA